MRVNAVYEKEKVKKIKIKKVSYFGKGNRKKIKIWSILEQEQTIAYRMHEE